MNELILLHGVNLNLLGERPLAHYGTITLTQLEEAVTAKVAEYDWNCLCFQTNYEGKFVEYLHEFRDADAIIINPGAWTHYSYALRDALEIVRAPVAEVHISDINSREDWRKHSVVSEVVSFTISGKGLEGYLEAVERLILKQ